MQRDIQKSRPGKRVGEVHKFGLRFRNGSTVSVAVTIPADGQATDYLLRWTGTPGRGDRKAYVSRRQSSVRCHVRHPLNSPAHPRNRKDSY
jgi:hypothetical protein